MGEVLRGKIGRRGQRDEMLSAYLDGELSPQEQERLEAQLAVNPELQAELEALRRTVAFVHELPPVPIPRNFILPETTATQLRPAQPPRPRQAWAAPLLTAATAIVSLACGVVLAADLLLAGLGGMASAPPAERMMEAEAPEAAIASSPAVEMTVEVEKAMPEATAPVEVPREAAEEEETDAGESYAPEGALETEATEPGENRAPEEKPAAAPPAPGEEKAEPAEPAAGGGPAEEPAAPAPAAELPIEETVTAPPTAAPSTPEEAPAPMATATPARAGEATPAANITEEQPQAPAREIPAATAITSWRVLEATLVLTTLALALATVWAWRARRR